MTSAYDAILEASGGAPYQGVAGQTRLQAVHLVEPDGTLVVHQVYRVVNVATHPELRARVLGGDLHRLPDGRALCVSFVYHDPDERKFALALPAELRHLEFKEWAALLVQVAEDTSVPVPPYVREAVTVVGSAALCRFAQARIEPDDSELSAAEDGVATSAVLRHRAYRLAQHERELRQLSARLSAQECDLACREQQLQAARTALRRCESILAARISRVDNDVPGAAALDERQDVWLAAVDFRDDRAIATVDRASAQPRPFLAISQPTQALSSPPLCVQRSIVSDLEALSEAELEVKLWSSIERVAAFVELCRRKRRGVLPALLSSLERMAPEEIACTAPHLTRYGDELAGVLVTSLGSPHAYVRQACALLMGQLGSNAHLELLVRRLDDEPSPVWKELARAVGQYGSGAFHAVARAARAARRSHRFAFALGHLANHGCAADVENMENHNIDALGELARRALDLRIELLQEDLAVHSSLSLPENSPTTRFSQAFYAEAAKVDI